MKKKPIKNIEDFDGYQKTAKVFEKFTEEDFPILQKTRQGKL
ncbi:hypothetical protein BMS3Abin10_00499 [bacterium BMS3Abin10]|nr:hypothetical protein BMS3Abin10_00499 [bacterium BMS3Abin10]GBE37728.1 hypothetical protein BMS3Bbin08_00324 [bacterium BMS3Bbin08]